MLEVCFYPCLGATDTYGGLPAQQRYERNAAVFYKLSHSPPLPNCNFYFQLGNVLVSLESVLLKTVIKVLLDLGSMCF